MKCVYIKGNLLIKEQSLFYSKNLVMNATTIPSGAKIIEPEDGDIFVVDTGDVFGSPFYPKSVIRISQCCMAMRSPLISPRWTGKTALFLKTLPDRGYACPLFCPNKPVLRLTRIG